MSEQGAAPRTPEERIEERIDKTVASATDINMALGGVRFQTMIELMEFAKMMAVSGHAVPPHLRRNPGACLAVCTRALRFNFEPFALAEHSYLVTKSNTQEQTMAYDSAVIHAIIAGHAPIKGRLKPKYEGKGDEMKVTAIGVTLEGETLEHESKTVGERKRSVGKNQYGNIKGSPLWETKPDMQIWYDARRDWARKWFPEILMGWYDKDEMAEAGYEVSQEARPETGEKPDIGERLRGQQGRGFAASNVQQLEHSKEKPLNVVELKPTEAKETVTVDAKGGEADTRTVPGTDKTPPQSQQGTAAGAATTSPDSATPPKRTRKSKPKESAPPPDTATTAAPETKPEPEPQEQEPPEETPMERGLRLLKLVDKAGDVADLEATIAEELLGRKAQDQWTAACNARRAEIVGSDQ